MVGYLFNTEAEAQEAVKKCNVFYNYPKQNCETANWCNYFYNNGIFIIPFDESIRALLGDPLEIDIKNEI